MDEQPIARAVLLYMFHLAKEARLAATATAATVPTPATPAAVSAAAKPVATEKAPKTLPPKVWSDAVNRYNSVEVGGVTREFPVKRLLGAESILATSSCSLGAHSEPLLYTIGVGGADFEAELHEHERGEPFGYPQAVYQDPVRWRVVANRGGGDLGATILVIGGGWPRRHPLVSHLV